MLQLSIMWQTIPKISSIKQPFYYVHELFGSRTHYWAQCGWIVCSTMSKASGRKSEGLEVKLLLWASIIWRWLLLHNWCWQSTRILVNGLHIHLCIFTTWWLGPKRKYIFHHSFETLVKWSVTRFQEKGHRPYLLNKGVKNIGTVF